LVRSKKKGRKIFATPGGRDKAANTQLWFSNISNRINTNQAVPQQSYKRLWFEKAEQLFLLSAAYASLRFWRLRQNDWGEIS